MIHTLNTRPHNNLGNETFHLPVIEIQPRSFKPAKIADFEYCIFLSVNAVENFFSQQTGTPNNIIAIGDSTENALINLGFKGIIIPKEFNSEGILALPQLKNIYNKSIAIISGESPRPLLSEKLIERGACIKNIFCYVRKPVLHDMNIIFPQLIKHDIKIIISASSESLFYLTKLFENPKQRAWLLEKEIHVISDKMKLEAENFGFKNIKTRNC